MAPWLPQLRELLITAADRVATFLPLTQLDVVTYATDAVIPELGVNGFAEGRHLLHMKIDPTTLICQNTSKPQCPRSLPTKCTTACKSVRSATGARCEQHWYQKG